MRLRARCEAASGWVVSILAGTAVIAYGNSFFGSFQFDDFPGILDDSRLDTLGTFASQLPQMVRPFLRFTFFLDRHLYGENPIGYHLLNLLLHIGTACLVCLIFRQALTPDEPRTLHYRSVAPLPFWTALVFLIHPITTETVTYISGRPTGLMAFFYLTALYLFITSTECPTGPAKFTVRYWGSLLCFMLSLLSKETAATLPAALLLWDVILRRRGGAMLQKALLRWHLPFWAVVSLFIAGASFHSRYVYLARYSFALRPVYENLLSQINAVCFSLLLFFVPSLLTFDHDFPLVHSLLQWPTPVLLLILATMLAAAFLLRRKAPFFAFGLLWFFLQLAPTNSLVPRFDLLSERNLYLASIGFFLFLADLTRLLVTKVAGGTQALHPPPVELARVRVFWALGALLVLCLVFSTISRNRVYRDQLSFWTDAVGKSPHKSRPHNNLGYAYYLQGDFDRAIEQFRLALSLDRDCESAQQNLRKAWLQQKSGGWPGPSAPK